MRFMFDFDFAMSHGGLNEAKSLPHMFCSVCVSFTLICCCFLSDVDFTSLVPTESFPQGP